MRQIVLDTETTGLEADKGDRIVEIGCVEVINRRITGHNLHLYINPGREVGEGAAQIHGLTWDKLKDQPTFEQINAQLLDYLGDAELIIHNAPFDLGFLNAEISRVTPERAPLEDFHSVMDTLINARERFPGQRNTLDALCKRFEIDNSARDLHGALLDSELLADVYLAMTGGQIDMGLLADSGQGSSGPELPTPDQIFAKTHTRPVVIQPTEAEQQAHEAYLQMLKAKSGAPSLWQSLNNS